MTRSNSSSDSGIPPDGFAAVGAHQYECRAWGKRCDDVRLTNGGCISQHASRETAEIYDAIVGAQGAVKGIDEFLTKTVGSSRAVAFDSLTSLLKELQKTVAPYAAPNENVEAAGESAGAVGGAPAEAQGISGTVRSRQDVIRVLEQICDFYRKTEPSSPVPLILQRARRLVDMDFVQLLTDLAPDSVKQIHAIAGIRPA